MSLDVRRTRKIALVLLGTIIGAGIFALPAMFRALGLWKASGVFFGISLMVWATHLLLADVVLSDTTRRRLAGYAAKRLGPLWRWIAHITYPLNILGTHVAYLLLGGAFVAFLGSYVHFPMRELTGQVLFWVICFAVSIWGVKVMTAIDTAAVWLLIVSMVVMSGIGFWLTRLPLPIPTSSDVFFPFGIFLFSLSGAPVIGECVELVGRRRRETFWVITIGTLGAAFLSWLFGVSLAYLSPEAIQRPVDAIRALPVWIAWLIPVIGFLAILTSYITTAQDLRTSFELDFSFTSLEAWVTTICVPMIIVLLVVPSFLQVIGFVGTVFGGINGILIALLGFQVIGSDPKRYPVWAPIVPVVIGLVYSVGILHEIAYHL